MKVIQYFSKVILIIIYIFSIKSFLIAQAPGYVTNTTTCDVSIVKDPRNNLPVSSYGILSAGTISNTTGNDPSLQTYSSDFNYNFTTNRYSFSVNTPNLTLTYFEIVKGARQPVCVPCQGLRSFQDPNGNGHNIEASFPTCLTPCNNTSAFLPTGITLPVGVAWTFPGKGFIRFFGYTGSQSSGYTLVEYKCLEVEIKTIPTPMPTCGTTLVKNQYNGNIYNTYNTVTTQYTDLNISATNAQSFSVVKSGTSSSPTSLYCNGGCTNATISIPNANQYITLSITPVGCNLPTTITRTFNRISSSSCPWCLVRNNVNIPSPILKDSKLEMNELIKEEISIIGNEKLNQNLPDVAVYPNPATESIFINAPLIESYVIIVNLLGQQVYRSNILGPNTNQKLDVSSLQKGMYLITFKDLDNQVLHTEKIILNR
jgi:Secretion system C-terminal sorting domain